MHKGSSHSSKVAPTKETKAFKAVEKVKRERKTIKNKCSHHLQCLNLTRANQGHLQLSLQCPSREMYRDILLLLPTPSPKSIPSDSSNTMVRPNQHNSIKDLLGKGTPISPC